MKPQRFRSTQLQAVAVLGLLAFFATAAALAQPSIRISVARCLPADTAGLHASVIPWRSEEFCHYDWGLSGGTITSGDGTPHITFTSGPPGSTMTFQVRSFGPRCFERAGQAIRETTPVASASGSTTILPGASAPLSGSGSTGCIWSPRDTLSDPYSCDPVATPLATTTYSLVVTNERLCESANEATVHVEVEGGPLRAQISVEHCVPPDTSGLAATTIAECAGQWTVTGGTITAGQGTEAITFTSGPPGTRVKLELDGTGCTGHAHSQTTFDDVPSSDIFHASVCAIGHEGITAGCGGGKFCRDNSVRRDQMAVFLLKARFGAEFEPPHCQGLFADVPCPGPFADWIEHLTTLGIAAGCDSANYCPELPVTRAWMAPLLLKARHGADFAPSRCSGVFYDVACPSLFADWIETLASQGITAGCRSGLTPLYCPDDPVKRGQMAAFLTRAFSLD